jgi:hypothetical protein
MSTPPAFTAIQSNFISDFATQEIISKQNKYRKINKIKEISRNHTMLRVAIPPMVIWAVLYCLVEYLI